MKNSLLMLILLVVLSSCSVFYKKNRTFEGASSSVTVEKIIEDTTKKTETQKKTEESTEKETKKVSVKITPIDSSKPARIKNTEKGLEVENAVFSFDLEEENFKHQKRMDSLNTEAYKKLLQKDKTNTEDTKVKEEVETETDNSLFNWQSVLIVISLSAALIYLLFTYNKH